MGYTTEFNGQVKVHPPLTDSKISAIKEFSDTRHCDPANYNQPGDGKPGLWCDWIAAKDGSAIIWGGGEKFYYAEDWMRYIIENFLQGHKVDGEIIATGEEPDDNWKLIVDNGIVSRKDGTIVYE